MTGANLECKHLWKVYGPSPETLKKLDWSNPDDVEASLREAGHVVAACEVAFSVAPGETFAIMGLSGSGKSTVVRCLSRLVEPTRGEVRIDGQDIGALSEDQLVELRRHKMGMVFQHFGLLPHLTVLDNVAYPLRVQGVSRADRERRAREMIDLVSLSGREGSYPRELSGGMQQRVGIARSLAVEPSIWFLDEPFSALDPLIRRQMQDEFLRLKAALKKTIIFITHDFPEALRVADRIAIMREGRIVQIGKPAELILQPANPYVAEFTRDVPRDKIVTASEVMEPAGPTLDLQFAVDSNELLEAIIPRLIGDSRVLAVRDEMNNIVGQISVERLRSALSRSGKSGS